MPNCPHCGYEGESFDFEFESVRSDTKTRRDSDRGVVCCPSCGAVLGGYAFKRAGQ